MDRYFIIGEISKIFNLPIKTLRYYDERGLVKPAYINKENNYRYYSVEQFIVFDVIKNSMEKVHNNILDSLKYDNAIFTKYNEERKYRSYGIMSKTVDELEINLRKVILDVENKRKEVYSSFGTNTSFELFKSENKIVNNDIRYFIECDDDITNYDILPEGEYI